jgi:hypothetical protein
VVAGWSAGPTRSRFGALAPGHSGLCVASMAAHVWMAEARGMARLTRFSLLSLPGSWSGAHRLWRGEYPENPGSSER